MPASPFSSWLALLPWLEIATIAFAFVWGAMMGSFLNVVAYRTPRGESVVTGGSRCPHCGMPVRPRDNVPVLGWIWLRGKCRDCGRPIPARYAAVEAACGAVVAAVAAADLILATPTGGSGIDRLLMHGEWLPLAAAMLHGWLVLVAVMWGLLAADGGRIPGASLVAAVGLVAIATVLLPSLQPVGLLVDGDPWPADGPLRPLLVTLAGAAAGWLGAAVGGGAGVRAALTLVGAAVGWQAVTVVAIVAAAIRGIGPRGGGGEGASASGRNWVAGWLTAFSVPLATAIVLLAWRPACELWRAACGRLG